VHIHHHTILPSQGGTTRVALSLVDFLARHGIAASLSHELGAGTDQSLQLGPRAVAAWKPSGRDLSAVHLHGSRDWPACLRSFAETQCRLFITLHDCRLLTGGCVYPLECTQWQTGCMGACPQGIASATTHSALVRDLLAALSPVLIIPSGWLARMARNLHPRAHIVCIPNGVAPAANGQAHKAAIKQALGLPAKAKTVLFAAHGGQQAMFKGGHLWPAIWKRIREQVPGLWALVVGGEKYQRTKNCMELPYVDQPVLFQCMRAADVLVYPSLADNHPLVVLEAMARNLPCAAFAVGGIPEQIQDGQSGLLARPGDLDGLAFQTAKILRQPSLGRHLATHAAHRYRSLFDLERMGKAHLEVYSSGNYPAAPEKDLDSRTCRLSPV